MLSPCTKYFWRLFFYPFIKNKQFRIFFKTIITSYWTYYVIIATWVQRVMSSKRKKINTFSASDISQKLSSRRPKRSHSAGKASSSRDHSVQSNSELETVSDGHIVPSAITTAALAHNSNPTVTASTANNDKTLTAEGYTYYKVY